MLILNGFIVFYSCFFCLPVSYIIFQPGTWFYPIDVAVSQALLCVTVITMWRALWTLQNLAIYPDRSSFSACVSLMIGAALYTLVIALEVII